MAYRDNAQSVTLEAAADLSSHQFGFVEIDSNGQVAAIGTAGNAPDGLVQNDPDAQGKAAEVTISGLAQVRAGGSVSAGEDVAADADGKAVTATSGDVIAGVAVTAAGAADEIFTMLFLPRGAAAA